MLDNNEHCASSFETVGSLPLDAVIASAHRLAADGGPKVPDTVTSLEDLEIIGHDVIRTTTQNCARREPRMLVSSGGTTGQPKLTFIPHDQGITRVSREWPALVSGDTMINAFHPGRLWGSHYLLQAIAQQQGAGVIPMGSLAADEVAEHVHALEAAKANAICATPTAAYEFCQGLKHSGSDLKISKILWAGEPWNARMKEEIFDMYPGVELWGNYGSIETYQIGNNFPGCETDVFHLMSDQILELAPEGALLTRVGENWTVPVVRYRLGDRIERAECSCGRGLAFRVVGRSDDAIKFGGTLFSLGAISDFVLQQTSAPGIQLVLKGNKSEGSAKALEIRVLGDHDEAKLHKTLAKHFIDIDVKDHDGNNMLVVKSCAALHKNPRTHKTPLVLWV
jgi:phenylacetate-coenzyme A ligase PaaK-like adenylate-forming protein